MTKGVLRCGEVTHFSLSCTSSMELLGFVLFIISLSVVAGIRSRRTRAKYPPGPMALPFIGHLHLLGAPPLHRSFTKLAERYGPFMYLRFGSTPAVVASSPEAVAAVFKSNDVTFANRQLSASTERLSYGRRAAFFLPYGPDWAFIKKLIASELLESDRSDRIHTQELHRLIGYVLEMSQSGQIVNFTWELLKMTRNSMCRLLIGKGLYLDPTTAGELEGLIRDVIRLATDSHFSLSNVFSVLRHLDLDGIMKRLEDIFQRFDAFLEKFVTEREELRKSGRSGDDDEEQDFLDVMLNLMEDVNSNSPITRQHIKALLLDNIIGGSESTAVAMDWTLAELVKHPDIMKKAQEEVDEVVGRNRLVDLSDTKRLTYIQAIIKESLRLHPPIPLLALTSSQECKISGYTVPANTILFVNVVGIGTDPKVWDEPLEFRPDRFLSGSAAEKLDVRGQHYQLLPFGTGKRSCPSFNSSLQDLTITMAAIVQCFDLKLKSDEEVDMCERVFNAGPGAPRLQQLQCFPTARFIPPNLAAS